MTDEARRAARAEVDAARADLVTYLNNLEDAVNFPRRIGRAARKTEARIREFAQEQPAAALAVAAGAAVLVGAVVTAVIKFTRR